MLQSMETEKLSNKEGSKVVGGMNLIVKEKKVHHGNKLSKVRLWNSKERSQQ